MMDNVKGKVIVITGASSGNGAATARHFAERGASVVLAARRQDRIDALAKELTDAGHQAKAIQTDVTDKAQMQNLVDGAVKEFGRIDVLLNNAGLMPLAPMEEAKIDEWDQMIDVNLKGTLYGIAAALPHMKQRKSGHIINVSSVYGHKLGPDATVYCATKFGVRTLSEGLRQEVKPYNIRTTVISRGGGHGTAGPHQRRHAAVPDQGFRQPDRHPADSFARMVAFAVNEPEDVDVNEILFRPTAQPI
ncbi:SDR family oxidoreductase [Alcanivorax sp. IO_7]|nr:SDR family oxidoreductase [Alcanivorax sp. IO_7]